MDACQDVSAVLEKVAKEGGMVVSGTGVAGEGKLSNKEGTCAML